MLSFQRRSLGLAPLGKPSMASSSVTMAAVLDFTFKLKASPKLKDWFPKLWAAFISCVGVDEIWWESDPRLAPLQYSYLGLAVECTLVGFKTLLSPKGIIWDLLHTNLSDPTCHLREWTLGWRTSPAKWWDDGHPYENMVKPMYGAKEVLRVHTKPHKD